jgi:hypothetical protein
MKQISVASCYSLNWYSIFEGVLMLTSTFDVQLLSSDNNKLWSALTSLELDTLLVLEIFEKVHHTQHSSVFTGNCEIHGFPSSRY